jgi:CheY-like chemotaxis protein
MTTDNAVKLLDAIAKLLGVLVWPAVVVFVLIRFGSALREFIASMSEFSLKGAGFEASGKRKAEAAAALAAAAASQAGAGATPDATAKDARAAADVVAEIVTPRVIRRAQRSTVLWVDDRPNNNVHEREALEALGVRFVLATSTEEAIERIKRRSASGAGPFDAVISDMGRPPDPRAGYTLLDQLQASGDQTPFIIYAGSRTPEHWAEARRHGAVGCTNRPDELFEMVLTALRRGRGT